MYTLSVGRSACGRSPALYSKKHKFAFLKSSSQTEKFFWEELKSMDMRKRQTSVVRRPPVTPPEVQVEDGIITCLVDHGDKTDKQGGKTDCAISPSKAPALVSPINPSSPMDKYLPSSSSVVALPPSQLIALQTICASKQTADLLLHYSCVDLEVKREPVVFGAAFHKLAQLVHKKGPTHKQVVLHDHRVGEMVAQLRNFLVTSSNSNIVPSLVLSNLFWSLTKLELLNLLGAPGVAAIVTQLTERLNPPKDGVQSMDQRIPDSLSLSQIASTLFCVTEIEKKRIFKGSSKTFENLKSSLISSTGLWVEGQYALPTDSTPIAHSIVSICTSIARSRTDAKNFHQILKFASEKLVAEGAADVGIEDLVSLLWSLTALKLTDSNLMHLFLSLMESHRVGEFSKRNLVDSVWIFAKAMDGESAIDPIAVHEMMKFTTAPAIRAHMQDLSVREIATVLWSYATGRVFCSDFFNDLSVALSHRVGEMNAHDVSSVVWALGSVNFDPNRELVKKIAIRAEELRGEFTPIQLARTIYGLGSVAEDGVYRVPLPLIDQAKSSLHLLKPPSLVDILIGLSSSGEQKISSTMSPFIGAISSQIHQLSGRDAVQVLAALARVNHPDSSIIAPLLQIIESRFNCSGRWIPSGFDLVDLVEAMIALNLSRSNAVLFERVLLHLGTVYKSPSFSDDLFLRLLESLSKAEDKRPIKKLLLLQEKGISVAFRHLTARLMEKREAMTIDGAVKVLFMYAQIGYLDDQVDSLVELVLQDMFDANFFEENLSWDAKKLEKISTLCAVCAELNTHTDWAQQVLESIWKNSNVSLANQDCIHLLWSWLALGNFASEIPSLDTWVSQIDVNGLKGAYLLKAQQIAVSISTEEGTKSNPALAQWSSELLGILPWQKDSGSAKTDMRKTKSLARSIDKYSSLVCSALGQLEIKHIQQPSLEFPLNRVYTVTASISPKVVMDVIGPLDLVVGSTDTSKVTGSRVLKNLHLSSQKYKILNLYMRDLQLQLEANSLVPWIADVAAPHSEKAKNRVSFKKDSKESNLVVDQLLFS